MKKSAVMSLFLAAACVLAGAVRHDASAADVTHMAKSECSNCHSAQLGKSPAVASTIAGQHKEYIENELLSYHDHYRNDRYAQVMWAQAKNLSRDEMKSLARYYGSQPPARGRASGNAALIAQGALIYGPKGRGCSNCHGANGEGVDAIPRLAGQDQDYLLRQIRNFRDGVRKFNTMQGNTDKMTDAEIAAVAAYLASK